MVHARARVTRVKNPQKNFFNIFLKNFRQHQQFRHFVRQFRQCQQFQQFVRQFKHRALMVEMLTIKTLTVCAQSFLSECYKCFSCKLVQEFLNSHVVVRCVVVSSSVRKKARHRRD